ncbi:MAG TPA: pyridoxal-dependent decarboxylase [Puia sp.]|nr:pyridoxal-dependent decarboxylase [Puia sp.]
MDTRLLDLAKKYALEYLDTLPGRRVFPAGDALKQLETLDVPLPRKSEDAAKVIETLHKIGSPNTVASTGGRYFGFVFGGSLPAALAADWLVSTWDQNAVFRVSSPIAAQLEKIASRWMLELLHLPQGSAVGFVTGTTMANFCGVLAARQAIHSRLGWDTKTLGVAGAPPIRVIVGEEVHASMLRALILAGFGVGLLIRIPSDDQGRIIAEKVPDLDGSTLLCLQAGNVNSGSIDPIKAICLRKNNAWVHVDGAFGLWAAASPERATHLDGCELADSWAIDLHKWLNVPYDSGLAICKDRAALQAALSVSAAYLPDAADADPYFNTPEMSRRARGIDTWAALRFLGKDGVAELIERCCTLARRFAAGLGKSGFRILNDVTLNQVLVYFGDQALTNKIIREIQDDGTCWCGGTVWKGQAAMRISVSSWMTTEDDVDVSIAAITRIARNQQLPI